MNDQNCPKQDVNIMLYRINRDNQELYINQEWKVIYYAVLLYAGIYAISRALPEKLRVYLYVAASITFVVSSFIIILCECSLCQTRKDIKNLGKELKIDSKESSWKSKTIACLLWFTNLMCLFFLIFAIFNSVTCVK
jgi:hypothetical protein